MPVSRLELRRVSKTYRNGGQPAEVLHDITLDVQSGECIAVLGATGSGKSTLMSLIPRFYDPTGGYVRVDGIDVRDLELDDLRRSIGIVFQESFLFSTTVPYSIINVVTVDDGFISFQSLRDASSNKHRSLTIRLFALL